MPFLLTPLTLHSNEYDKGVNTFNPEGRIFQVEYAMKAIKVNSSYDGICNFPAWVVCTWNGVQWWDSDCVWKEAVVKASCAW